MGIEPFEFELPIGLGVMLVAMILPSANPSLWRACLLGGQRRQRELAGMDGTTVFGQHHPLSGLARVRGHIAGRVARDGRQCGHFAWSGWYGL